MRHRVTFGSFIALIALIALGGCGVRKIPESDVDPGQKAAAIKIASKIYEGCRDGRYESLGDEAIAEMRDALTPDKQKKTCAQIQSQFGDYKSMDYAETWKQKGANVYRFKGHFSKTEDTPEIRVVLDSDSRLTGFWLKPWSDSLK
jgi:hypothetical protein